MEVKQQWPNALMSIGFIAMALIFLTWQPLAWWRVATALGLLVLGVGGVIVAIRVRYQRRRTRR